ncbi:hypothetical protein SAMN05216276_101249 [Streptosporangium subroseum]|uniref:Uncharacterized protein n=1 Tax=Streptosporangium subroseum TaxID=106412 RepID=A0A239FTK7_9ACTN|nr:hypothetical protein [Streptosporangium subroseum]SNS59254.1 hypothetical protein SAMN05216276_101249 [Streptosporangium subroseum]
MTNHPVASVTVARAARLLGVPLIAVLLAGCGALGGGGDATAASAAPVRATSEASVPPAADAQPSQEPPTQDPSAAPDDSGQGSGGSGGSGQARTVAPGGTLADGDTVSAELTRAGQKDTFTLDLGGAREFYVADMRCDGGIKVQVIAEIDGKPEGLDNLSLCGGNWVFKLSKAGGHRLEITGDTNVIGPYSFRLATVKVRSFPVKLGLKIGEGSPAGAGRLAAGGEVHRFEFDADGASAIKVLGGAGSCLAIEMELVDAAETSVATARQPIPLCGYELPIALSNGDGRYALVIRSAAAKTGPYSFQLVRSD